MAGVNDLAQVRLSTSDRIYTNMKSWLVSYDMLPEESALLLRSLLNNLKKRFDGMAMDRSTSGKPFPKENWRRMT